MKVLANDKMSRLLRRMKDLPEDLKDIRVVLNKGQAEDTFDAKIIISVGGINIFAEESDYSLESALIGAADDAERQFEKEKGKMESTDWEKRRRMKVYQFEEEQ
jgi:ribosome-associated translation inhibitor RaiA